MRSNKGYDRKEPVLQEKSLFGRMNDPSGAACVQGPCGDSMEFYLAIHDDIIIDVRYYTEGCETTKRCGAMAARMVCGKPIKEAMDLSAGDLMVSLKNFPDDHLHCPMLAISTLYRAIADYLLRA